MKKLPSGEIFIETDGQAGERIAYRLDEAARLIGYSRNGLYPYLASGELKSCKVGKKKRLIKRSDLLAFLDQMAVKNVSSLRSREPNKSSPESDQNKTSAEGDRVSVSLNSAYSRGERSE